MALSKSRAAITQLTASGTSTALDVSASYGHTLYLRHANGSPGPITTAATFNVQVKASGGTYVTLATLVASTTTGATDSYVVRIPDDAASVQIVYTAPTGATGTLDAEVGTITAL